MAYTHSHEGCGCHHDHEDTHDHKHEHGHDCCDHHEAGVFNKAQRWVVSGLIIISLLIALRPLMVEQLLIRETSYSGNSDYKDAIRIGEKIIFLDAQNIRAWDALGFAYLDSKQFDLAIPAFEKVLAINPHQGQAALFELGEIYFAKGDYPKAISYFEGIRQIGLKASAVLEADLLKYRHGTLGFRNLNSMQTLLQDLSAAYLKVGDRANAAIVQQEYEYYKAHQSKVLF